MQGAPRAAALGALDMPTEGRKRPDTVSSHERHACVSFALSPSLNVHDALLTVDNDNDTLRKVPHPSNEGLALQARV